MSGNTASSPVWLRRLQTTPRITALDPIAARFVYAMRLLAVYKVAGRDPAAELAVRLESVTAALHAMELAQALFNAWPEAIVLNRFCCKALTHDEATIAGMITAAAWRNRDGCNGFEAQLDGLVRHDRKAALWDAAVQLVGAEMAGR